MGKKRKRDVDLVVLSDIHLGTYGCHAEELLRYLKSIRPKCLVLNGDIIDMWQFSKRYWPKSHMQVVKHITGLLTRNTKIIYLTGNHDEMLRKFSGFKLGSFHIDNKAVLKIHGKKVWIFHGDVFDVTMQHSKWFAKMGAMGYDTLILINTMVNWCLRKIGRERISLSKRVKDSVKSAIKFINDFEPISAWACRRKQIPCVALSHQSALLSPKVIKPKKFDPVGEWVLKNYAPADHHISFHFACYDKDMYTPVIRSRVRTAEVHTKQHYTVYLPAYDDRKLIPLLTRFPHIRWHIFSKHAKKAYHVGKLSVFPVNNEEFTISMATATGVLCGAGFETPAEALYLGKKVMVVPMKRQYEQHYNAAALRQLGVPVLKKVKKKYLDKIEAWLENHDRVSVHYEDITDQAVQRALALGLRK